MGLVPGQISTAGLSFEKIGEFKIFKARRF
jgi:hypothetical protein